MQIMKNDAEPVEIINNLFIGSVGASANKNSLIKNKITHIISAGSGLKKLYPEVFLIIYFRNLLIFL